MSSYLPKQFNFGIEIEWSQKILEGWLVGVWDGDSWDPSQRFRGLEWSSQQNPNKWNVGRCSIKLPRRLQCFSTSIYLGSSPPFSSSPGPCLPRLLPRNVAQSKWSDPHPTPWCLTSFMEPFPANAPTTVSTLSQTHPAQNIAFKEVCGVSFPLHY